MSVLCGVSNIAGVVCRQTALPGAPFPICMKHAAAIRAFLDTAQRGDVDDQERTELQAVLDTALTPKPPESVVYYLRCDDLVKIGFTDSLAQRLTAYPPRSVLLGIERGGRDVERQRHLQFRRSLRSGREWFAETDDLTAHIAALPAME